MFRLVLLGDCDFELEVQVEGKANDVEAGANVGGRAGYFDVSSHFGLKSA